MIELKRLEPYEIRSWEKRLFPFINRVCARSRGRYAPEHILGWARSGEWQIWLVLESGTICFVGATEILTFPTGLKALAIRFGTGAGRERWQHLIGEVLAWGKAQGCGLAEGTFRKGWRRALPGWNHVHDVLERSL